MYKLPRKLREILVLAQCLVHSTCALQTVQLASDEHLFFSEITQDWVSKT